MSSLASTYALAAGVPLSQPWMTDTFYPLETPLNRVILVHAFAGQIIEQNGQKVAQFAGKCYDHFAEVVSLLSPIVAPLGYRFYQIGGKDEPPLKGAEYLCGKTSMSQCAYLVKNAALLIANDSMWCHVRGAEHKSLIALYGTTDDKNHGPHWRDYTKTAILESHRCGKRPSYAMHESPKTINFIPPESVANAALYLLGGYNASIRKVVATDLTQYISPHITRRSLYIGPDYPNTAYDIVPDMVVPPQTNVGIPTICMDLKFDEQCLAANLQARKCGIVTDREINLNLLAQFRPNIAFIRVYLDAISPQWMKTVRRLGVPIQALSRERDEKKLRDLRLAMFDAECFFDVEVLPDVENLRKEIAVYTNKTLDTGLDLATLSFRTNRFLLSSGKIYLSVPHWRANESVVDTSQNTGRVIDAPEFWGRQRELYLFQP